MKLKSNNNFFLYVYYFIFVFIILIYGFHKPYIDWDIIGYVASAKHFEIKDKTELHKFVYKNLKYFVDEEKYKILTNGGKQYRIDMAGNPVLFYQQLPFYEIRVLYNLSILLLSKIGFNIFASTYYISIFCSILAIFLLFFAIKDKVHIFFLYIFPFYLILYGLTLVAKFSSPDAMIFLCISLFIYLFSKEKINAILFITPLFVLVRTDTIIFNFTAIAIIFFLYKDLRLKSVISLITSTIIYIFINNYFKNYGWATIFSFSLIKRVSNPADVNLTISISDYITVLGKGIINALKDYIFVSYVCFQSTTIILLYFFAKKFENNKEIWIYTIVSISNILIRFILFPVTWERLFIGFYVMSTIATFLLLSQIIKKYSHI
jgi:hypothetical protein